MNRRLQPPYQSCWFVCAFTALLLTGSALKAQPSGGPYGPIQQNYAVPAGAAHVYYVAPDGAASAEESTLEQPTTLETAISKAVTGDAIILRGGTYRTGGLRFNQGISIQSYAGEHPVLKGTRDGHVFCGNLLVAGPRFSKPLLRIEQRVPVGKLTKPQVTQLDGNVYVRNEAGGPEALLFWSPLEAGNGMAQFKTLEEFQKLYPRFESNSRVVTSWLGALFKSPELSRYELVQDVALPESATPLPAEVRQLLGWQKREAILPGAYPSRP